MNFFKKGKYNLGGKTSKSIGTENVAPKEYFYKMDSPSTSRNGNHTKETTAAQPVDPISEDEPCFRFVNKTTFVLKQKDEVNEILPQEISPNESKLIKLGQFQSEITVSYVTETKTSEDDVKTYEFQLKLVKQDKDCLLTVDWMNLTTIPDIQFKPDITGNKQPIHLNNDETVVEISIAEA